MTWERPDRRIRAHELKAGDCTLLLDGRGERARKVVKSAERDGRTIDVTFENGEQLTFGQNDYVYLKLLEQNE